MAVSLAVARSLALVALSASLVAATNYNYYDLEHKGCFADDHYDRALPYNYYGDAYYMTHEKCYENCEAYEYFGVQNGNQCWCGNDDDYDRHGHAYGCDTPCSGDYSQTCGNQYKNDVFCKPKCPKFYGYPHGKASDFWFDIKNVGNKSVQVHDLYLIAPIDLYHVHLRVYFKTGKYLSDYPFYLVGEKDVYSIQAGDHVYLHLDLDEHLDIGEIRGVWLDVEDHYDYTSWFSNAPYGTPAGTTYWHDGYIGLGIGTISTYDMGYYPYYPKKWNGGVCYKHEPKTPYPTKAPTPYPTKEPTPYPTKEPTPYPTKEPTPYPTKEPTPYPTKEPTPYPTKEPTPYPTKEPTPYPTKEPTPYPTKAPTPYPTKEPTPYPTKEPTPYPTKEPTPYPTKEPTPYPTKEPTPYPTKEPTPYPIIYTPPPCDKVWVYTPMKWIPARAHCESLGGHLPIIRSEAEEVEFRAWADENMYYYQGESYHMGYKANEYGVAYWVDDTPVTGDYVGWGANQPMDNECGVWNVADANDYWWDQSCYALQQFGCQICY